MRVTALPRLLLRRSYTTGGSAFTTSASSPIASRPLPTLHDFISPTNSHLLRLSLTSQLPFLPVPPRGPPAFSASDSLPAGHHLLYFPPQLPEPLLLADGSDAEQNPGEPYTRRMWAGGEVRFAPGEDGRGVRFYDQAVMKERVESVKQRGEKMFVWFERRIWSARREGAELGVPLDEAKEAVDGKEKVVERRCLVFMPPKKSEENPASRAENEQGKAQKLPYAPDFFHTFMPSQHLLFRYSALTFNAHKIHYDTPYTQTSEGHIAPLCHGPMAATLMLELCSAEFTDGGKRAIEKFEYKCQSPMYVDRPYTLAGKDMGDGKVELWVVNEKGGVAVRGVATVV